MWRVKIRRFLHLQQHGGYSGGGNKVGLNVEFDRGKVKLSFPSDRRWWRQSLHPYATHLVLKIAGFYVRIFFRLFVLMVISWVKLCYSDDYLYPFPLQSIMVQSMEPIQNLCKDAFNWIKLTAGFQVRESLFPFVACPVVIKVQTSELLIINLGEYHKRIKRNNNNETSREWFFQWISKIYAF